MTDSASPPRPGIIQIVSFVAAVAIPLGIAEFFFPSPDFSLHIWGMVLLGIGYVVGTIISVALNTKSTEKRILTIVGIVGSVGSALLTKYNVLPFLPDTFIETYGFYPFFFLTGFVVGLSNANIDNAGIGITGMAIGLMFGYASLIHQQNIYNDLLYSIGASGVLGILAGFVLASVGYSQARLWIGILYGAVQGFVLAVVFTINVGIASGGMFCIAFASTIFILDALKTHKVKALARQAMSDPEQATNLWDRQPISTKLSQAQMSTMSDHLASIANADLEAYLNAVADLQATEQNIQIVATSLNNITISEMQKCSDVFAIAEFKKNTVYLPIHRMDYKETEVIQELWKISEHTQAALNTRTQEECETGLQEAQELVETLKRTIQRLRLPYLHDVLDQWKNTLSSVPSSYNEAKHLPLYLIPDYLAKKAIYDKEAFLRLVEEDEHLAQQADWAVPRVFPRFVRIETERCSTPTQIADFYTTTQWVNEYLTDEQECAFVATLQRISQQTYEAINTPLPEVQTTKTGLGAEVQRTEARFNQLEQSKMALEKILSDIQSYNRQNRPAARENIPDNWSTILQGERDNLTRQLDFTRANINELIERNSRGELPSPYKTGGVLGPKSPLFQGRDDLFTQLRNIVNTPTADDGVLVLGQPRTGKTSLLRQLPVRLGENILSVYVDMHQASTGDANALIHFLGDKISTELKTSLIAEQLHPWDRDSNSIHNDDPYQAFRQWITQVEQVLKHHGYKLLLSLDEFYRIDDAFYAGRLDANQLLALFRNLIFEHSGIALIFCGTVTLQECHPAWVQVLKALRTVKVTYLPPEAARLVFSRPTPDFPSGVYDESAIDYALHITRGHPMMLHALGKAVVEKYNRSRAHATLETPKNPPLPVEEVQSVVENVLTDIDAAFLSIFQWAMQISSEQQDVAKELLVRLAHDRPINDVGTNEQRTKLLEDYCNRDLLEKKSDHPAGYDYQVPLMKEWVKNKYIVT